MIYTLTMNPAIDMNIEGDGLYPNIVNRTRQAQFTPNGKGLNVSTALQHYSVKSCTLGFYGGFSGRYIVEAVKKTKIDIIPSWIDETTRINVFYFDGEKEFKLVNEGPYINRENLNSMYLALSEREDMEMLVISGSLPKGVSESYLEKIGYLCKRKNTRLVLDVCVSNYAALLKLNPFLIKPNDEELDKMLKLKVTSETEAIIALQKLHALGAQNIFLTLGAEGSYFFNGKQMFYVNARKINLLSSACAGDVALGAFLSIFQKDAGMIKEAMIRASAAGANSAEQAGPGDFSHAAEYERDICVKRIAWK